MMNRSPSDRLASAFAMRTSRRSALQGLGGGGITAAAFAGMNLGTARAADLNSTMQLSNTFSHRLGASDPLQFDGGSIRAATASEFPVLSGMSIRSEEIDSGVLQALHWHPNAGELHYVVAGQGGAGVVSPVGEHATFDLSPGSISFFPKGHYHYVHNSGAEPIRVLSVFTHESPTQVGAAEVVGFVPKPILAQALGVAAAKFPDVPVPANRPFVPLTAAVQPPPVDPSATKPEPYTVNLGDLKPAVYEGGTVTNVRGKELARLDGISILPLYVEAGAVRTALAPERRRIDLHQER